MKRSGRKAPWTPRIVPAISTSSKIFVDKKTKSRSRRALNRLARDWD